MGCRVKTDEIGNIFATLPGKNRGATTAVSSHLDTHPDAGKYDGILDARLVHLKYQEPLRRTTLFQTTMFVQLSGLMKGVHILQDRASVRVFGLIHSL